MRFGRKARIVAMTFVATTLLVLLVANLALGDKRIDERVPTLYGLEDPQFRRVMDVMLGPALRPGNRVQALVNGDEIFPAMLAAIRGARRTITFETYVYYSGRVGAEFSRALAERARAGIKVHVIFDAVGAGKIDEKFVDEMKAAGVEVERYNPVRWHTLARMNNRTHRKLLVVDGSVGFTGGVGIADEWAGDAQDPKRWRDTHFRVEGPVVAQMQAAFMENWIEITGEVLHGEAYFPPQSEVGQKVEQYLADLNARTGKLEVASHDRLLVPDLAKATALYRDTLGATVSAPVDQPAHGVTVVFVELPNTKIEFIQPLVVIPMHYKTPLSKAKELAPADRAALEDRPDRCPDAGRRGTGRAPGRPAEEAACSTGSSTA